MNTVNKVFYIILIVVLLTVFDMTMWSALAAMFTMASSFMVLLSLVGTVAVLWLNVTVLRHIYSRLKALSTNNTNNQ